MPTGPLRHAGAPFACRQRLFIRFRWYVMVSHVTDLQSAADLFKALSSPSRLGLLCLLAEGPLTVGVLVERSGLSQPLVSQHLRTLREAGLVSFTRVGREARYAMADAHVFHLLDTVITHVSEGHRRSG